MGADVNRCKNPWFCSWLQLDSNQLVNSSYFSSFGTVRSVVRIHSPRPEILGKGPLALSGLSFLWHGLWHNPFIESSSSKTPLPRIPVIPGLPRILEFPVTWVTSDSLTTRKFCNFFWGTFALKTQRLKNSLSWNWVPASETEGR